MSSKLSNFGFKSSRTHYKSRFSLAGTLTLRYGNNFRMVDPPPPPIFGPGRLGGVFVRGKRTRGKREIKGKKEDRKGRMESKRGNKCEMRKKSRKGA